MLAIVRNKINFAIVHSLSKGNCLWILNPIIPNVQLEIGSSQQSDQKVIKETNI